MSVKGTVLVAEDDRKTAELVRLYLVAAGFAVQLAADGASALAAARDASPDLVVLDWMLPRVSGISVCRALRRESDVPVILLTARAGEEDRLRGLETGADDYVTKPFSPRELVARVRAVLRRARAASAGARRMKLADLSLDRERHEARLSGARLDLTPAEFRLLEALLSRPRRPQTRRELSESVFSESSEAMERTIDAHVMKVRRKMRTAAPAAVARIETVFGVGYRLGGGRDDPP
jgi:DNA-binding response OmpR family regulator